MKTVFPTGELFEPFLAAVKEPQFSAGIYQVDVDTGPGDFTAAFVSFGEHFGLVRWQTEDNRQWQLSIVSALFAQFNLDTASEDLINSDFAVGLSGTHRAGAMSYRLRLVHQSSHLGDELLLSGLPIERINFSFEAIDFAVSYERAIWRIYTEVSYLLNVEPAVSDRTVVQLGSEFHTNKHRFLNGRWNGGIDLTAMQVHDWEVDVIGKIGLEYGSRRTGNRRLRIMLEAYDGKSPFGQFLDVDIRYYGIAAYLGF